MAASDYRPQIVNVIQSNSGYLLGGSVLFRVSTSVTGANAANALNAYANQYDGRHIPLWFKDNRLLTPSMSFASSPVQSDLLCYSINSNWAFIYFTLKKESLAGEVIRSYLSSHDSGYPSTFPYTLFWDISYNYISSTSMSINKIGMLLDYDV